MEYIGHITLNISLIIYFVHFLPQSVHNQLKHKTNEISLLTHSLMIVANSLDLIYAVGVGMQWQYILVDIILLSFLLIQQFQILNDKRNKAILLHTCISIAFLVAVVFVIYTNILSRPVLIFLASISGIVYNVYWFPQIYKNHRQKDANGFSIIYLWLALACLICDINSAIFLGWPEVSLIISCCLSVLILIQIYQYFYYKGVIPGLVFQKYVK